MDAWSDSQHFMVTTDIPTPSCINNFEAAGITDMHLPAVANVPYNDFLEFQAYSHQIDPSQLSTLNNMFDAYSLNSSNWDFQNMLTAYDLPAWDMNLFPPVTPMWNPYEFEYNNFGFSSFDTPMDFAGTPPPTTSTASTHFKTFTTQPLSTISSAWTTACISAPPCGSSRPTTYRATSTI